MDVNKLVAGRELDALVAERVMGIKLGRCSTTELEITDGGMICPSCEYCDILCTAREHDVVVRHYSQHITAAWEVFEKAFRSDNENGVFIGQTNCGWEVIELVGHDPNMIAQAETAPLAICRAALEDIRRIT